MHGNSFDSPLHHAAHNGHIDAVAELLNHGANLHGRDPMYLSTPLGWAQAGSKENVVHHLRGLELELFDLISLDALDEVNAYLAVHPDALESTLGDTVAVEIKQHEQAWQTPLAYAAIRGKADVVKSLLEFGANAEIRSPNGKTLHDLCADEVKVLLT